MVSSHVNGSAPTRTPARVGRYEIVGPLASGGMAEVLLAWLFGSHGFERPVVVKRMLPHLARDPLFVKMFIDEARIIAGIRHPNVVNVVEFGSEGEDLFLVMEYLEGEPASGLLRRMKARHTWLDISLGAYVVAEACAGLHAAHELTNEAGESRNLVHRDVSPQNVFITYDGAVKVLDFGIAKAADRITRTETGQVKGKESYMSPEQALALPLDRRSDIFSLGVVLYELTTARRLFKRPSKLETLEAVRDAKVKPPSKVVPGYPARLESVVLKALAKEPGDRFATAAAMRRELLDAAREAGLDTVPDEALSRWMHECFDDRIKEKADLLQSLRGGQRVTDLPVAEVDLSIDIPGLDSDVSRPLGSIHFERTQTTQAWSTSKRDAVGTESALLVRSRSKTILVVVGLVLCLAVAVVAALFGLRDSGAGDVSEAPVLDEQRDPATASSAQEPSAQEPSPVEPAEPAQEQPSEPAEIVLELESTPSGATVVVEGQERGATPLDLRLPRGSGPAHVELRLDGYEPARETIGTDMNGRLRIALTPRRSKTAHPRAHPVKAHLPPPPPEKTKTETPAFHAFD